MFFRKKTDNQADTKQEWAHDAAYDLLMTQFHLGGALEDEAARNKLATPYGLGYVFGFVDALLQRAGVTDEVEAMAALLVTYVRIFGKEQGPKVFSASLNLQRDKDFAAGRTAGGGEVSKWLEDSSPPLGLTDYLNERNRLSTSATLPAGSTLWDVEGIPVAEIPTPEGGLSARAFDRASGPRWFPFGSTSRNGKRLTPDEWDALVEECRRERRP